MTVLAQSFFTLVRRHLVAFTFFSVWHDVVNYKGLLTIIVSVYLVDGGGLLHLVHEHLSGLESRNLVLGDNDDSVLADVAGGLLRTGLHDEATKSAKVNILAISQRILYSALTISALVIVFV